MHLLGVECGEYASAFQVAIDAITRHPLADDAATLERHGSDQPRSFRASAALDNVDITAVTIDDLTAVASRGSEANLGGLKHDDPKSVLEKK